MGKDSELKHEATGRGSTKKLAKQGAAARVVVVLFPQLAAKIKPKGLLDEVVPEVPGASGGRADDEITHVEIGPDGNTLEW